MLRLASPIELLLALFLFKDLLALAVFYALTRNFSRQFSAFQRSYWRRGAGGEKIAGRLQGRHREAQMAAQPAWRVIQGDFSA